MIKGGIVIPAADILSTRVIHSRLPSYRTLDVFYWNDIELVPCLIPQEESLSNQISKDCPVLFSIDFVFAKAVKTVIHNSTFTCHYTFTVYGISNVCGDLWMAVHKTLDEVLSHLLLGNILWRPRLMRIPLISSTW